MTPNEILTKADMAAIHAKLDGIMKELKEQQNIKQHPPRLRLIDANEACKMWGVCLTTFRRMAKRLEKQGMLQSIHQGSRLIKYKESEIIKLAEGGLTKRWQH